ncbi:hypothetical protein N0V93_007098 [Gnomoniopsis smithogilvyi]|uniref:Uncharacterized protein n=1 Tax=Gnomoniopsis smithogilvyi TaxID=1191159 RepID=A0A9W8YQX2_9PEZI|nr:hypothetical protein N0V93_007098 [Gnomoniopsis smithogilvyi]
MLQKRDNSSNGNGIDPAWLAVAITLPIALTMVLFCCFIICRRRPRYPEDTRRTPTTRTTLAASITPSTSEPTASQFHGLAQSSVIPKTVRFADDVIQNHESSKDLVSPPPKPEQSVLERLSTDFAALPFSLHDILTPVQMQRMEAGEDYFDELGAAVALCEMRQGATRRGENGGACPGPLEVGEEKPMSPGETQVNRPKKIVLRRPSREISPEKVAEKRPKKIILHMSSEKRKSATEVASPEKPTPMEPKLEKPLQKIVPASQVTPRKDIARKLTPRKVTPRKGSPKKISLHLTPPNQVVSDMHKASPGRDNPILSSAERRSREHAWLVEYKKRKAGLAPWNTSFGI